MYRIQLSSYIHPITGCWEWQGAKNNGSRKDDKLYYAFWRLKPGTNPSKVIKVYFPNTLPDGMNRLHKCGNSLCVNPNHLYLGTRKNNTHDSIKHGTYRNPSAEKTHCKWGHEFTIQNTYVRTHYNGRKPSRQCRVCNRKSVRLNRSSGVQ